MCGIFGINKKETQEFINKIISDNNHRGPDQNDYYQNESLTLIHNRLSILDIEHGCQPMYFKDLVIIYNGEIFNSVSLRKSLEDKGYNFETNNSDTEVLLKLYHFKGKDMLLDLNGMFAFVIYDKKNNILFGAVDRFSIKPLYYTINNNLFSFSSEIKPLLSINTITKKLSKNSVFDYFQLQYVPFENTIYEEIKKIKNSNFFVYDLNLKSLSINEYKKKNQKYEFKNYNEIIEVGKNCLNNSIKNWSQSDVPISCSLSGGLDSSLISAIFAKNSSKKIETITVGFDGEDKNHDERYFASKVSKFLNSDHLEVVVDPKKILFDMDKIFENLCEPYGGSLASWYVYN
ncbi:asparagine synthase (glutamine-hydrolyzing), partial [Candidatus Pelagibacter sp.]